MNNNQTGQQPENCSSCDPGPGNEGKEWLSRDSETEMMKQGNRQPSLRGIQSPGPPVAEDDLPEWLRVKDAESVR